MFIRHLSGNVKSAIAFMNLRKGHQHVDCSTLRGGEDQPDPSAGVPLGN